jgi:hypothetical protein
MNGENDAAPGWAAIDAALERLYGDAVPLHVAPEIPSYLGGQDPLDGISIYARDTPVPHWHLISYGMTELYEKTSDNKEESGWGFEFTLRAIRRPDALQPPAWAVMLVQQLATYVYGTGRWFEPGHTMRPGGLTLGDQPTELHALAFTVDSELGVIATPFGRVTFLQIAALTEAEYEAAREGNGQAVLDALAEKVPLHVIDPARGTLL